MKNKNSVINSIDEIISYGVKKDILHLRMNDENVNTDKLMLNITDLDKHVLNFGSCSYLGLEFDQRLKRSSIAAIEKYGTQFSTSRAYISLGLYEELENLFDILFDAHTVVAPTTTLGHIAAIPVLVDEKDAVILDHLVHNSVLTAVNSIKTKGVYTELIRHNRMDLLEERIKFLRQKYNKIWYFADGVYSMYGDTSPVHEIFELMNKYPEFHYYVDDAHGMSCFGKNGKGYILGQKFMHKKMILVTSLAKGFATGGAVLVFPTKELARKVRTCGSPFITSGPLQPATLGAAIASAKIHLSEEIYTFQKQLRDNILFTNASLKKTGLPLVSESDSAIFFIGLSLPKIAYNLVQRMFNEGFYVNLGIFPAVPIKNTGIRFAVTRLHTFKQIENMVQALAYNLREVLKEEDFALDKIYQAFKITAPAEQPSVLMADKNKVSIPSIQVQHEKTITTISKTEWDELLGERGTYDWDGLKFIEESFTNNTCPENNWEFDYLLIKDNQNKPVLATFFTTALCKEDMFSSKSISEKIESKRQAEDPYYLTSKILLQGSMLTAGNHLYLNRLSPVWKKAMAALLEKIAQLQEKYQANITLLRDFEFENPLDSFFVENGYFKISMPENHVVKQLNWRDKEEYLKTVSKRSKTHIKQDVFRHENKFEIEVIKNASSEDIKHWYQLYLAVKKQSFELNTFTLPYKVFENMAKHPNWEIMTLKLKPEFDKRFVQKPVAITCSYLTKEHYHFMIVGIDYSFQQAHKCYKQALYQVLNRAKIIGKKNVCLGYSASLEKQKFGAYPMPSLGYVQASDNYSLEVIAAMNVMDMELVE